MPAIAENRTETIKNFAVTNDTINLMVEFVNNYSWQVSDLAKKLKGANDYETGKNIWEWVKTNIAYEIDGKDKKNIVEQVRTPARTIADKKGDCDCMAVLVASLLKENHIKPFFKVVGYKEKNIFNLPICTGFSHVYTYFYFKGKQIFIDTVPEIPFYNYEHNPQEICKTKNVNIMKLEALFGVNPITDPNIILQEKILNRVVLNGSKPINNKDFSKKFSILAIEKFEEELKKNTAFFEDAEKNLKFIDDLKKSKNEEEYLTKLKNAPINKEFYFEVAENYENGLNVKGIEIIEDEKKRIEERENFNIDELGKVSKIKKTILTPIREAFKLLVISNFNKIAEKLAVGFSKPELAEKKGFSKEEFEQIQKAKNEFVKKFSDFGGTEEELKKAVAKNKKAIALLNGIEDEEDFFNGIEDEEDFLNGIEDEEEQNLGVAVATGIAAATATATPLIVAFGNIFKNVNDIFKRKSKDTTKTEKENLPTKNEEKTATTTPTTTKQTFGQKLKNFVNNATEVLAPKQKTNNSPEMPKAEKETNNKKIWLVVVIVLIIIVALGIFWATNSKKTKPTKRKRLNGIKKRKTTKKAIVSTPKSSLVRKTKKGKKATLKNKNKKTIKK